MSEITSKPPTLTSEPKIMHKIKYMQFRKQLYPLIAVMVFMIVNIFWLQPIFQYLTIVAFGWYLLERIFFRTKNKILVPEAGAFVSPVEGKVQSVRKSPDATLITLRKSIFDVVELRLPYPDMQTEIADNWNFETPAGQVNIRIKARKIKYFDSNNKPGSVIGVIPGKAVIVIHVPASINVLVNEKQNVFGGETELFSFAKENEAELEPKSILVEEPI
jgi:hypothetical protein